MIQISVVLLCPTSAERCFPPLSIFSPCLSGMTRENCCDKASHEPLVVSFVDFSPCLSGMTRESCCDKEGHEPLVVSFVDFPLLLSSFFFP